MNLPGPDQNQESTPPKPLQPSANYVKRTRNRASQEPTPTPTSPALLTASVQNPPQPPEQPARSAPNSTQVSGLIFSRGNPNPTHPKYFQPKPRRQLIIAAICLVIVALAGSASYGGYRLLSDKQTPKTGALTKTSAAKSQPGQPVQTTPEHKSAAKTPKPSANSTKPTNVAIETPITKPPVKSSVPPARTKSCKDYSNSYCYLWVGGRQAVTASGVSVQFDQAQPKMGPQGAHTLVELAVMSADGQQVVEVGWILPDVNGGQMPRLFVYHWVGGKGGCYDGCGFVQVSSTVVPASAVTVGVSGTYKINYSSGQWQIFYNGTEIGYYPKSLWGGRFTKVGYAEVFGEVAATSTKSCTQMGNGVFGSSAGSLLISNYTLLGSATAPNLSPYNLNNFNNSPNPGYNYGSVTPTSLRIGGPGSC